MTRLGRQLVIGMFFATMPESGQQKCRLLRYRIHKDSTLERWAQEHGKIGENAFPENGGRISSKNHGIMKLRKRLTKRTGRCHASIDGSPSLTECVAKDVVVNMQ